MTEFSYSFCMAMMHSLWQSALLMLLYLAADAIFLRRNTPLVKRNFLFVILFSQVLLFTLTFFVFYSGSPVYQAEKGIGRVVTSLFYNDTMQLAAPWLFLLYSLVIGYKLTRAVYSWAGFKKQYQLGLQKPGVDLRLFTSLKAHQFGITRKVKLWFSSTINTPVTFGFFKPVILLPVALVNNISTRQAETLIIHELIHIRTNDYLLNWFLLFTETVFFFNPFIHRFCSQVRMEREKNCDMGVMAFEYSPVLYAETLLQAERMKQLVPGFQLAAVNRKKQLLNRIRFFSGEINFSHAPGRFNIFVPALGLLVLLLFSSGLLYKPGNPAPADSVANTSLPYLPFSSLEIPESTTYASEPVIKEIKESIRRKAESVKQEMASENKRRELQAAADQLAQESKVLAERQVELINAMPVAVTEADGAKQIIIQEESSGSTKSASVKTYVLRFDHGQWILEPVWTLSTRQVPEDSLLKKMDSSNGRARRILPAQQ